MTAPWQRLLQEKLHLAKQLLEGHARSNGGAFAEKESRLQGAIALLIEARQIYLVLLAQAYQHKKIEQVPDLQSLESLLGSDCFEVQQLRSAERGEDHWWGTLRRLEKETMTPRPERKAPQGDHIIAVSDASTNDRSPESLIALIEAIRRDVAAVCERHSEW